MRLDQFAFLPEARPGQKSYLGYIAEHAVQEDWGPGFSHLARYVDYNFEIAHNLGMIKYEGDNSETAHYCLARVGNLVSATGEPITMAFVKNNVQYKQPWRFFFVFRGDRFNLIFGDNGAIEEDAPPAVVYAPPEYHAEYRLKWNFDHYLKQHEARVDEVLPTCLSDYQRFLFIYGAVTAAHAIAQQIAVPEWHRDRAAATGSYKWFLPLYLDGIDSSQRPTLVAAVDPDDAHRECLVRTLLTPDMAYPNARAICFNNARIRQWMA